MDGRDFYVPARLLCFNNRRMKNKLLRFGARLIMARTRLWLALLCSLCGIGAGTIQAQTFEVSITVTSLAPPRLRVEGQRNEATTAWSFRDTYASLSGLDRRLEQLSFADSGGQPAPAHKIAPGEYSTARPATRFSYQLKLDPPPVNSNAAHVSWLAGEQGVLMLGDILPLPASVARVRFSLPTGWTLASTETPVEPNQLQMKAAEDAVVLIGRNLRERKGRAGSLEFAFVTTGDWAFGDEEATLAVKEILQQHGKTTGVSPSGRVVIALAPFPLPASASAWSAETRGRTVFLLSGRWPSAATALSQLNVPLTHELFHLWVPNSLALEGEYDWFYEGFTSYQSLRAGMRLGYFSFQDYLNAVGRAYDSYKAARGAEEISLIEASKRRWTGAPALVYSKGMLIAFLYDLTLRLKTSNKRSLDDVYRGLFQRYQTSSERRQGNEAAMELLGQTGEMQEFTRRQLLNASEINLPTELSPFGLQLEPGGIRTRLSVSGTLTRAQKDLLRSLGYNEHTATRAPRR